MRTNSQQAARVPAQACPEFPLQTASTNAHWMKGGTIAAEPASTARDRTRLSGVETQLLRNARSVFMV